MTNTFLGLDPQVRTVRYVAGAKTVFRVVTDPDTGEEFGEIVFGPDIYPGPGMANPNSVLSMQAAAAHELAHFHRWVNKTQLNDPDQESLDEALTSLEAVMRYEHALSPVDIRELVSDAHFRLCKDIAEEADSPA